MAARPHVQSLGVPESWVSPGTQLGADDRSNFSNSHLFNLGAPWEEGKVPVGTFLDSLPCWDLPTSDMVAYKKAVVKLCEAVLDCEPAPFDTFIA